MQGATQEFSRQLFPAVGTAGPGRGNLPLELLTCWYSRTGVPLGLLRNALQVLEVLVRPEVLQSLLPTQHSGECALMLAGQKGHFPKALLVRMFRDMIPCWYLQPHLWHRRQIWKRDDDAEKEKGAKSSIGAAHRVCIVCPWTNTAHGAAPVITLSLCAPCLSVGGTFSRWAFLGRRWLWIRCQAQSVPYFRCSHFPTSSSSPCCSLGCPGSIASTPLHTCLVTFSVLCPNVSCIAPRHSFDAIT